MRAVRVAILGMGFVGAKLMEYIRSNIDAINYSFDIKLTINKVFVRQLTKIRAMDVTGLDFTDNPNDAINDADIVIECMGGSGTELTRELILKAINEERAIIMSSKKCLALYGEEIYETAIKKRIALQYDATVGGGIPISSIFEYMGRCEHIDRIYGICNATSNFILDEMQISNSNYQTALHNAIEQGFAENDPEEDVSGKDALYKCAIMTGIGMRQWIDCSQVKPVSIKNITQSQIKEAKMMNCILKPIFNIKREGCEISCSITPQAVPYDSILSPVRGNNNIIVLCSSESGERAFYGQGAGPKPTASAMYDDLMKILNKHH